MCEVRRAQELLKSAEALLITTGAGMGVDSGLPDFRGTEGFWNAYPEAKRRRLSFSQLANPAWFEDDPTLAWAFYGHRLHLYRDTAPHVGFAILLGHADKMPGGAFVVTSNVDGQFQKSGFAADRIYEVHGSIHHLQCSVPCCDDIWSAQSTSVPVDMATFRAASVPRCPHCGAVARPNILMFGDYGWISRRSDGQEGRFESWLHKCLARNLRICIVEIGAGKAVPTIRHLSENVAAGYGASLIRINPRDSDIRGEGIAIATGAVAGLSAILPKG